MQKYSILTLTVLAAGAVAAETFGTLAGATAAAGEPASGVFRTDATAGEPVPLDCLGTTVVVAGGAVALDEEIEVGADGKAVAHDAGVVVGRATQAADGDGDRIEVLLIPNVAAGGA